MKRVLASVAVVVSLLIVTTVAATPAGAGTPEPSNVNDAFDSEPIDVNGDYIPLVGLFDCDSTTMPFILWYAPGPAPDYLWWITSADPLEYDSVPVTVNGDYDPVIGDFDGDGCDDVFWYAPGAAADYVWYGEDDGTFTSMPLTVNGTYEPMVGSFDDDDPEDVFWYAPGSGQEYIWTGQPDRTFDSDIGPRVNGTYRASASRSLILFHQPGPAQDYIWTGVEAGMTAPGESLPVEINGSYEPLWGTGFILLYAPGVAQDFAITDVDEDTGELETIPGTINGTYTTGVRSSRSLPVFVWHAPGPAQDFLWVAKSMPT